MPRVTDRGWMAPLVWLVGPDIADNRLAVINTDTESERIDSLSSPRRIELRHFASHTERRAHRRLCIFRRAVTAHVPPNRHDRVTDKFIEGATIIENHRHHRAQIT